MAIGKNEKNDTETIPRLLFCHRKRRDSEKENINAENKQEKAVQDSILTS